ncbi:hypothetical protein HLB03_11280 [Acidianus sp. DSM 29099]|nr:hypothetical protein [Acidianus sp. RZ1]
MNRLIIKTTSVLVEALLVIGLAFSLVSAIIESIQSFSLGFIGVAEVILENVLLIIVFLEVYLSVYDFFQGRGRSIVYVIDATISFLLREIIIDVISGAITLEFMLAIGVIIGVASVSRYLVTRTIRRNVRRIQKK